MRKRYGYLLKDKDVERWYNNVKRGSAITADIYLRRLGNFCKIYKLNPKQMIKLREQKLSDLILDCITDMEKRNLAGSYIASCLKAIRSWLAFNGIEIKRKIKIKGAQETPRLKDERVPTQKELKRILLAADLRARVACLLMAHSGLRPSVLGNYYGNDGLRISDLPELIIDRKRVEFKQVPTLIKIRPALSKRKGEYFTFLSEEGCEYLREYLEMRIRKGEKLDGDSAIITPKTAKKEFIKTTNIGDMIRKTIRRAGFGWRPYVLRSYFATQLMLAESKGLVLRDYRQFWMGHVGDIEHVYTLNKRLPANVIEDMRQAYQKAQRYLQTSENEEKGDIKGMFRKQLLLVAGFKPEEIKEEYLELDDEEFQKLVREKLIKEVNNNNTKQRVAEIDEIEKYLQEGWEFVAILPNNKVILKMNELA